jgi:cyanophycin synthetase
MIDAENLDTKNLKTSKRLICEEILSRGWKVHLYYYDSGLMRITRTDGRQLEVFSATPPTTTYAAAIRANNKYLTTLNCANNKLPVPETYLVASAEEAETQGNQILASGRKIVIKPLDAAHGHGVTTAIDAANNIKPAIERAAEYSGKFLVQEHLEKHIDLRLTCIDYKFCAGLIRLPARVKGDGQRTVSELIELENQNPLRGENYSKQLNVIDIKAAEIFLGDKIRSVPASGDYINVLGTANVGTGGETIDITDELPDWLIQMAEQVAKISELPVCGIDFLVQNRPDKSAEQQNIAPKLIEVNVCPALFLHVTPSFGQSRSVIKSYVDYLATI